VCDTSGCGALPQVEVRYNSGNLLMGLLETQGSSLLEIHDRNAVGGGHTWVKYRSRF